MTHLKAAAAAIFLFAMPALAGEQQAPDPALLQALASQQRTPKFIARDPIRHPAEELAFFGLRPDATVVEIEPGAGYWTEILAPYLMAHGTYYVALPTDTQDPKGDAKFRAKLAAAPDRFSKLQFDQPRWRDCAHRHGGFCPHLP